MIRMNGFPSKHEFPKSQICSINSMLVVVSQSSTLALFRVPSEINVLLHRSFHIFSTLAFYRVPYEITTWSLKFNKRQMIKW